MFAAGLDGIKSKHLLPALDISLNLNLSSSVGDVRVKETETGSRRDVNVLEAGGRAGGARICGRWRWGDLSDSGVNKTCHSMLVATVEELLCIIHVEQQAGMQGWGVGEGGGELVIVCSSLRG